MGEAKRQSPVLHKAVMHSPTYRGMLHLNRKALQQITMVPAALRICVANKAARANTAKTKNVLRQGAQRLP